MLTVEDVLVVRVPSNCHVALFVEVEVAAIRPLAFVIATKSRHDIAHQFLHPWWEGLRRDFYGTVSVCAGASVSYHPCCFARQWAMGALRLQPLCVRLRNFEDVEAH